MKGNQPKRSEVVERAVDTLRLSPVARRRLLAGTGLFSASMAASALLTGCSAAEQQEGGSGAGDFPKTPKWRFVFVNHVTTNPFFQPTQYGAADACALLGLDYQWTGSETSKVSEMVNALRTGISGEADGIAVSVVDEDAFRAPVDQALEAGIPVVSYNADGTTEDPGSNRLGYIGQDLFTSGVQLGERMVELVDSGPIVGFIATPGQLNIQPRIDGAKQAIQDADKDIEFVDEIATGAKLPEEQAAIDAYWQGHQDLRGMFAVDAGSTQMLGEVMAKYELAGKGVVAGGFDLVPETLNAIDAGDLAFTIDQQPYLQGFLPVLMLYFYQLSGGLVVPPETNTGLSFVTKENVQPFRKQQTRFDGSSEEQKLVELSGPISHD